MATPEGFDIINERKTAEVCVDLVDLRFIVSGNL
jgi:hypothetical protein